MGLPAFLLPSSSCHHGKKRARELLHPINDEPSCQSHEASKEDQRASQSSIRRLLATSCCNQGKTSMGIHENESTGHSSYYVKRKYTQYLIVSRTFGDHYMSSQAVVGRSRHEFVHQGQTVYQWDQSLWYVLFILGF
jgi:hypothetical protein